MASGTRAPSAEVGGNVPLLVEPPIGREAELAAVVAVEAEVDDDALAQQPTRRAL